jgi:hypothetical protein
LPEQSSDLFVLGLLVPYALFQLSKQFARLHLLLLQAALAYQATSASELHYYEMKAGYEAGPEDVNGRNVMCCSTKLAGKRTSWELVASAAICCLTLAVTLERGDCGSIVDRRSIAQLACIQ